MSWKAIHRFFFLFKKQLLFPNQKNCFSCFFLGTHSSPQYSFLFFILVKNSDFLFPKKNGATPLCIAAQKLMDMNKLSKFYWKKETQMLILRYEVLLFILNVVDLVSFSFSFSFFYFLFSLPKGWNNSSLCCCSKWT